MAHTTQTASSLVAEQLLSAQQQVLELVARAAPLSETLSAIARFSEATIPTMKASVLVFDPVTQCLRKGGYASLPSTFADAVDGMAPGPATGSCGTAAFRKERVISEDIRTDPLWGAFRDFAAHYGIQSAWSSPVLAADGRLLGVFGMYYGDCRAPSADDLTLVDRFVHLAAIAIERQRFDADRDHEATHDSLTGLGNRRMLERAVAHWERTPPTGGLTVALIDLDHFKMHNENLGHRLADQLLQAAAARIAACTVPGELVVRYGGDQFVLITSSTGTDPRARFPRVIEAFNAPFEVADMRVRLSVSAGLVEWNPAATNFEDALYQAEQACASAKERGRERWIAFGPEEREIVAERRRVARVLTDAIATHRVVPHLQPIVDLATGRPVAFEMLARLAGTGSETISPSVFIPIAEESSLIDSLGMSMLRQTFRLLATSGSRIEGLTANVNVSLRQLLRDGFPKLAIETAQLNGVSPERVCLEVTESQWLEGDSPAREALLELKAAGFRLALDDFGTGYASLNQLQEIPFDHVKIDKVFVARLGDGGRGTALCETALRMAAAYGIPVTAEGVETQEQARLLAAMGCDRGQGYYWSRPAPADITLGWLDTKLRTPVGAH